MPIIAVNAFLKLYTMLQKTTLINIILTGILFFLAKPTFAQTYKTFTVRENIEVKGSMLVIGNTILGRDNLPFNDVTRDNQDIDMRYIDIDADPATFSSSSAQLMLPLHRDGTSTSCYRVAYAALYWGALLQSGSRDNINQIKLKLPGSSAYNDVTGEVIYDAIVSPIIARTNEPGNTPYACYADVTSLLSGLSNVEGTYTVANVTSSLGFNNSTGLSAGWTLFVIYEDPSLHTKSFTTFDGFSHIFDGHQETVPVTGFAAPTLGHIDLQFAYATMDGDRTKRATKLEINGKEVTTPLRPANKFFGSVIENTNGVSHPRNPFSDNTLGYDTGFLEIINSEPEYIKNGDTSADFRLQVARGQADPVFAFFSAFAVDIIAPDINLIKTVEDASGNDIGGTNVFLGQQLFYEISYQSTGNDNVTQFTIKDILPQNIEFDPLTDIDLSNAGGATLQSYNPATRTLIFTIPDASVEVNDPVYVIRLAVRVVNDCYDLSTACSNEILNQAFATYRGVINPTLVQEEGSFANANCLSEPGPTNFLVDISNCNFYKEEVLCGNSVQLTAASGYDSYSWSTSPSGTPVIGTTQSIDVTNIGTYYVKSTASATCISIEEEINVVLYGNTLTNPIIPYADHVSICPNDGKELPKIFLCGANDFVDISLNIGDATSIVWEVLDENSCMAIPIDDCANEEESCSWNQVGSGQNFTVDTSGQFRLVLNYPGGCFSIFYFNVYENLLAPTVSARDIICSTPGQITVGGVPSGYEYSIDGTNYQPGNSFAVGTPGTYTVYVRQVGVSPNPCIFSVPNVFIRQRDFSVTTIVQQPDCYADRGTIILQANDALPQYYYSISSGGTLLNSVGPVVSSDHRFDGLSPGVYTYTVSTEDGCTFTGDIEIVEPVLLEATVAITVPLTCTDGELTVYPTGGTPPYYYFVNGSTAFQTVPEIAVTAPGTYDIRVVDLNNCEATASIAVDAVPPPDLTVSQTNILCADATDSGSITVNVSNANGNALRFSADNGATFQSSPNFTGLTAGNYDIVVEYSFGGDICTTSPQAVTITSEAAIDGTVSVTAPFTCTSSGEITVSNVTGGVAPYQYSLDGVNFQNGTTFTGLTPGTYTVTVRDANQCTHAEAPVTIEALTPPTDLGFSATSVTCPSNTADVTLTATGGSAPLGYRIVSPAAAATAYQTSNIFTGLAPGTYTFQVRDANNCVYAETYTIDPLPPLTLSTVIAKTLDCTATPDGVINGTISGGTAPFTYAVSVNGGSYTALGTTGTAFSYTVSADGSYQFRVTDANSCTVESGVQTINAITLPEITSVVQTQDNLCNGDSNASIDITINNTVGTPPFVINVNNDTTGTDYGSQTSGLPAGSYTITLTDSNSCEDVETIVISEPNPLNVVHSSIPITCDISSGGTSKGSVIVDSVSGGTAPYNYYVTGTNGYSATELNASGTTSTTFDVVDFGLYQINVVDANGCSVLVQDVLVASPPNDLDISIDTTVDCTLGGEAVVSIGTSLASSGPFYFDIYRGSVPPPPPGGTWAAEDSPGSQSATFTGLVPGVTYTFIVFDDSTGCSYYETADASVPTNSTLTTSALTSNNITCTGSADGNVSFTINSTYPVAATVSYDIINALSLIPTGITGSGIVPSGGTLSVSNLGPLPYGTYFVSVTETAGPNAGCGVVTQNFNITESARDLAISASVNRNANCNPSSGLVSAVASDGTPPYQYQITTTSTAPLATDPAWAAANTFNVGANTYYVHVKDAYNCIRTTTAIVLPQDPAPVIAAAVNNQCTVTQGNFAIDVALTATGIAPYSYSVDGGAFQTRTVPFTITNLASGTHTVEVRDANGCGNLVSVAIAPPVTITPSVTALPTCNDDDGEITVTASGGTGAYTYTISPTSASISLSGNVFSGVPSGTYTIRMTDANTCFTEVEVFLPGAIEPIITTAPMAVTCFGDSSGSFQLNVSNYTGAYTYEVYDASSSLVLGPVSANTSTDPTTVSGLMSGTYSIIVSQTDSPFCSATADVTIQSPPAALQLTASETSNVTCDNNSGTITAVASGGWGTYEYELTGAASVAYSANGTFTDLQAGSYTVNVRDSSGCIASDNVVLDEPTPIDATIAASTPLLSCFGDSDATITVTATGGQGSNYSYTLNQILPTPSASGPQTSTVFGNLGAGTYNVTVTDGYNCEFTSADIVIDGPTEVEATLVRATPQTCTVQASLTLGATGGTGPYEYSTSSTFAAIAGTFASSTTFTVAPGDYQYYVRDTNGCVAAVSNQITIDPLPALTLDIDATNATINCTGDTTGAITAVARGGLGNYVYTLQDSSGNAVTAAQDSPGVFTGLAAGDYRVRVDSGDCLFTSGTVNITQPQLPLEVTFVTADVTCSGGNNGLLEITATGGTGIIKYAISPQLNQFFDEPLFENLAPGTYQAIAQDELGCFVIIDFDIDEPAPVFMTVVPNSIVPELCSGDANGSFSVEVSGGSLPYSVSLDNIDGPYITGGAAQTIFDFTGLSGGNHVVYIRDSEDCGVEFEVDFPGSVTFNPELAIDYSCVDNTGANTVTVSLNEGDTVDPADLEYALDGGTYQASNVFVNVAAGLDHYIDVRHVNGCVIRTATFDIEPYQPLTLVLREGSGFNEIEAVATGGSGNYEFTLNGESYGSATTFIIYETGTYTVTVTDRYGCTATATIYMEFIDVCIPNYFVPLDGGWAPGCVSQYRDLTFDIFDRYGRKVATLGVDDKWDGTYKGKELPTGDYWYVVRLNDNRNDRDYVGHFTLYR